MRTIFQPKRIGLLFLALVCALGSKAQDSQDKNRVLTDPFLVRAAVFVPVRKVEVGVEANINVGASDDIDFDETFGIGGPQTTFNLDFTWRFSKSRFWSVSGQYFRIAASQSAVLQEDITWEDVTFEAGSGVRAGFGLSLYRVFFGRAISTGAKHELGAGLGIHAVRPDAFIEGAAVINGEPIGFKRQDVNLLLPLPNIGAWYYWAPDTKWSFTAHVDWLFINLGDLSGGLWNISPGVAYQLLDNIALSVNYHYLEYYADLKDSSWRGSFNMAFNGPSFGVIANF